MEVANREQVLAFRLAGHNLARRLPPGSLLEAAAARGIQNTPPGSAELALQARVTDLTPAQLEQALVVDKTLLQLWSIRHSPLFFPTSDAAVFTIGLLPVSEDEESFRFYLPKLGPVLDEMGMSAREAEERVATAAYIALDGKVLSKAELSTVLGQHLPEKLLPWCAPCGSHHVSETQFRRVAWRGLLCFTPREGSKPSFIRTDQWLGHSLAQSSPAVAQAELVRRYLRCYGPSTAANFEEWAGIAPAQARSSWQLLKDELLEISFEGKKLWLHQSDLKRFNSSSTLDRVRLLPPHDAYLFQSDRTLLLPDKALHSQVWRALTNPGVVLVDGQIAATWRTQKKGKRLLLTVTFLRPFSPDVRAEVEAEAALLAPFRACQSVEVEFSQI